MKRFNVLIVCHALYIFMTAVWALLDIESFMKVTGPKTDIWLVKTVGALLIPVSLTMLMYLKSAIDKRPVIVLGSLTASALICIDLYYALNDVIHDIYLADAAIEFLFLAGWLLFGFRYYKYKKTADQSVFGRRI